MDSRIILYIAIFCAKLIEVSVATLRTVLNNRGQKRLAACIGFFEVMIWVVVASNVLNNITEDPIKVLVYCFAFSMGNFIGVTLEEKLALGMSVVEVLAKQDIAQNLADALREKGYGVTTIESSGKETKMVILKLFIKRKQIPDATQIIRDAGADVIFSVSDVKKVTGGFIK